MTTQTFFSDTSAAGTVVEVSFEDSKPHHVLGYWSIRGLGAPLTMMLCAAKKSFSLFLYDIVEEGELGWNSEYFAAKGDYIKAYNQPLWNLPFCVDKENEKVVCQTNAIFLYLGRSCEMIGDDKESLSDCETLLCEIYDLRNVMVKYAYGSESNVSSVIEGGKKYLEKLESWLEIQAAKSTANDHTDTKVVHLINCKFSAPDFHLYEMLDQFEALASSIGEDLYSNLTRLKDFKEGFAKLDENQFYLNSWLHKKLPFNNCMAKFGSLPGPNVYVHGESAKFADWRGKGIVKLSNEN